MITITIPNDDICFHVDDFELLPTNILQNIPGIYRFFDKDNNVLYIGKTERLRSRLNHHLKSPVSNTLDVSHNFYFVRCFYVGCPMELDIYETYLINTLRPPLNVEKTFTYKSSRHNDKYQTEEALEERKAVQEHLSMVIRNREPRHFD